MGAETKPDGTELLQLSVDVRHPGCWTLEATAGSDVGLMGYGTTRLPGSGSYVGYYTAFGNSRDAVEELIETIGEADRVADAVEHAYGPDVAPVTRNLVVHTGSGGGMRETFRSRGFLHLGPTYHRDGSERRSLLTRGDRETVSRTLAAIEAEHDADLDLRSIASVGAAGGSAVAAPSPAISVRQREAFRLARKRGYYEYPREADAEAIADELGITKSTFLEHLRKAERTLLANAPVH
ncbi:helix-turn-helix domain-containing protein [Halorubrum sp. DTA98]|uniref:helix-turn-helix domain-containing protein n=1 Tax=Halorubrum sp. DTA98 TaxID=3402163 RepID=UPI003AAB7BA5